MFPAAKEITNARRRDCQIKIKFLLPQSKRVQVKHQGNVVKQMTVRRHAVCPGQCKNRKY